MSFFFSQIISSHSFRFVSFSLSQLFQLTFLVTFVSFPPLAIILFVGLCTIIQPTGTSSLSNARCASFKASFIQLRWSSWEIVELGSILVSLVFDKDE